jgi:hypothetical protein
VGRARPAGPRPGGAGRARPSEAGQGGAGHHRGRAGQGAQTHARQCALWAVGDARQPCAGVRHCALLKAADKTSAAQRAVQRAEQHARACRRDARARALFGRAGGKAGWRVGAGRVGGRTGRPSRAEYALRPG